MLDGRERYLPDTIGSGLENRGVYLCTWLYKNGDGDPIWLDRYFNSSITSA
jgi:hypothetical protein